MLMRAEVEAYWQSSKKSRANVGPISTVAICPAPHHLQQLIVELTLSYLLAIISHSQAVICQFTSLGLLPLFWFSHFCALFRTVEDSQVSLSFMSYDQSSLTADAFFANADDLDAFFTVFCHQNLQN